MTEPDITELYERLDNHLFEQDYDKAIDLFKNLEDDLQAFIKGDEYQNNVKHLRDGTGEYHIAFYESPPTAKP